MPRLLLVVLWRVSMVPTPSWVNSSRISACGTRPSSTCTRGTVSSARRQAWILGIMPPEIVPSSSMRLDLVARRARARPRRWRRGRPGTSVNSTNFSALERAGDLARDRVGVDVERAASAGPPRAAQSRRHSPARPATGSARRLTASTSPTRPRRSSRKRARSISPSRPLQPQAETLWPFRYETKAPLMRISTSCTTSSVCCVGEAAALDEVGLDAEPAESLGDLRPAAVHEHRVDAEPLEPDDVVEDGALFADRAADFDDDGLADVFADVRQRFEERVGLSDRSRCASVTWSTRCSRRRSPRSGRSPRRVAVPLPRPRSTRMRTSSPRISARAASFEAPVATPSRAIWTEPIHSAAASGSTCAPE